MSKYDNGAKLFSIFKKKYFNSGKNNKLPFEKGMFDLLDELNSYHNSMFESINSVNIDETNEEIDKLVLEIASEKSNEETDVLEFDDDSEWDENFFKDEKCEYTFDENKAILNIYSFIQNDLQIIKDFELKNYLYIYEYLLIGLQTVLLFVEKLNSSRFNFKGITNLDLYLVLKNVLEKTRKIILENELKLHPKFISLAKINYNTHLHYLLAMKNTPESSKGTKKTKTQLLKNNLSIRQENNHLIYFFYQFYLTIKLVVKRDKN